MDAARTRLLKVSPAEVKQLITGIPGLADAWAHPAKVSRDSLAAGERQAVSAIRAGMPRFGGLLFELLASAAVSAFRGAVAAGGTEADRVEAFTAWVAEVFDDEIADLVLGVVAESRAGFESIRSMDVGCDEEARAKPDDGADDGGQRAHAPDDSEVEDPLASLEGLLASAPDIARRLHRAADGVESGTTHDALSAGDLAEYRRWCERVEGLVPDGSSVGETVEALRLAAQAEAEALNSRLDALRGLLDRVERLESIGERSFAEGLLRAEGFDGIEALREAADMKSIRIEFAADAKLVDLRPSDDRENRFPPGEPGEPGEPDVGSVIAGEAVAASHEPQSETPVSGADFDTDVVSEEAAEAHHAPGVLDVPATPLPKLETARATPTDVPSTVRRLGASALLLTSAEPAKLAAAEPEPDASIDRDAWRTVAGLIAESRDGLAVLAAETCGGSEMRTRVVRLFGAAFSCRAEGVLHEPQLMADGSGEVGLNADDNRVLFAAHARLALELGYSPIGTLDRFRSASALDEHPALELSNEVVRLVTRGFKRPVGQPQVRAMPNEWKDLCVRADTELRTLASIRTVFHRATKVVHYWARKNQPIGGALEWCARTAESLAVGGPADAEAWETVRSLAGELRDPGRRDRFISDADDAVSKPQQRRHAIEALARGQLHDKLDDVAAILEAGLDLIARSGIAEPDAGQGMADLRSIAAAARPANTQTIGDAALARLVEWICLDESANSRAMSLQQLLDDELRPLFRIPRGLDGRPERTALVESELDELIARPPFEEVFEGYLRAGNIIGAEEYLRQSGTVRTDSLDDRLLVAQQRAERRHRDDVRDAERTLDRLRWLLHDDDLVLALSAEFDGLRTAVPKRFDYSVDSIRRIRERGEARLAEIRTELRDRAISVADATASRRILDLLDHDDEQLATEYLMLAEIGAALPEIAPPAGDDFGEFFPDVVRAAEAGVERGAIPEYERARRYLVPEGGRPENKYLAAGTRSWGDLAGRGAMVGAPFERNLANVLRMIGLRPASSRWLRTLSNTRHSGFTSYAVQATPDAIAYAPLFGTQAHSGFDVTLVWKKTAPAQLLRAIESNRQSFANIILYFGTLSVADRFELRKATLRAGFSPIVIDAPVIAWLSTRAEPGWRMTQRVVLPFTTVNPFAPFAGGEVPAEVFVGREDEQRDILDPTGSLFVYGGRQLGKSALLRRVERGLMRDRADEDESFQGSRIAVYLDLKVHGIGDAAKPSHLWRVLGPALVKNGVLTDGEDWDDDRVCDGILNWLEEDASRQLLLLLDEADNFLTADAKDTGVGKAGGFPVLQRLKGVMEGSGRRFKPVFAGLHQVQRFHDLPNTPVVHGGRDILIGPLKQKDASALVRDPLLALGYRFDTDDTIWRLLRLTNYQASLVQVICEALVKHMRERDLPKEGGRIVIADRDVEDVYAKPEVRDQIASRFRWTINLDSRYRVIALVTAMLTFESAPGRRFRAGDLHDECASIWDAGFSRKTLTGNEFLRHLDEMCGLGVLYRQGDEFGLRTSSILSLLGPKDAILSELLEASEELEVGYEYNPTMNRRLLDPAQGAAARSPLNDSDLALLLSNGDVRPNVRVVFGTAALGIDRVGVALLLGAQDRRLVVTTLKHHEAGEELLAAAAASGTHVIVDASQASADDILEAAYRLSAVADLHATLIVRVQDAEHVEFPGHWERMHLRRWTEESLQSWQEPAFAAPRLRRQLRNATGGWPSLVEGVIGGVNAGSPLERAIQEADSGLRTPEGARRFLGDVGIPLDVARIWVEWCNSDEDEPLSSADLGVVFEGSGERVLGLLQALDVVDESADGWVLDRRVIDATRCLSA